MTELPDFAKQRYKLAMKELGKIEGLKMAKQFLASGKVSDGQFLASGKVSEDIETAKYMTKTPVAVLQDDLGSEYAQIRESSVEKTLAHELIHHRNKKEL